MPTISAPEQHVSAAFSTIDTFADISEQKQQAAVSESPLKKLSAKEVVSITQLMCPTTLQEAFDIIIQPNNSPFNNTVNSNKTPGSTNATHPPVTSSLAVPPALQQQFQDHIIAGQPNTIGLVSPLPSGISPRPTSQLDLHSGGASHIFSTPILSASQSPEMSLQTFTLHETSPPTITSIHGHGGLGHTASNYTFAATATNGHPMINTPNPTAMTMQQGTVILTRGSSPESIQQREGSFVLQHPGGAIEVEGRMTRVGSLMAVKAPPGAPGSEKGEAPTMVLPVTFVGAGSGAVQSRSHLASPVPLSITVPRHLMPTQGNGSALLPTDHGNRATDSGCPTPTNGQRTGPPTIVNASTHEFVPITNDSNLMGENGSPHHGFDTTSRSNQIKSVSRAGEAKGLQKQIKKKQIKDLAEKQLSVMLKRTQEALAALTELEKSHDYQQLPSDSELKKQVASHHKTVLGILKEYDGVASCVNIKLAEMGLPALVIDEQPETPLYGVKKGILSGKANQSKDDAVTSRSHSHYQSDIPSEASFRGSCSPIPEGGHMGFSSNTSAPTTVLSDKSKAAHPYPVSSRFQSRDSMSMPSGVGHHPDSPHDPSLVDHFGQQSTPHHVHKPNPNPQNPLQSPSPVPSSAGTEQPRTQPMIGLPHSRRASVANSTSSDERLIDDSEAEVLAVERRHKAAETREVIAKMTAELPEVQSDETFIKENHFRIVPHTAFMANGLDVQQQQQAHHHCPLQASPASEDGSSSSPISNGTSGDHNITRMPPFTAHAIAAQILSSRTNSVNELAASPISMTSLASAPSKAAVKVCLKVGQILSIAKMIVPQQGRYADCRIVSNGHGADGQTLVLVPLRKIDSGDLMYGSEARVAGNNLIATGEGRVMSGNEARVVTWYYEAAEEGDATIFCKEMLMQPQREVGRSRSSSGAVIPNRSTSQTAEAGVIISPQDGGQYATTVFTVTVAGQLH